MEIKTCCVCGGNKFDFVEVLWPELISDWELLPDEVDYVNRQQGFNNVKIHSFEYPAALAIEATNKK
jgi:hypothetical protein